MDSDTFEVCWCYIIEWKLVFLNSNIYPLGKIGFQLVMQCPRISMAMLNIDHELCLKKKGSILAAVYGK